MDFHSGAFYTARDELSLRPMVTLTDAEVSVLPGYLNEQHAKDKSMKEELLASAQDLSQGVLSAWSYGELQADARRNFPEADHQRNSASAREVHGLVPRSTTSQSASRASRTLRNSARQRAASVASRRSSNKSTRIQPPLKKQRGRPVLALSAKTAIERRRAQLRTAQRTYRSRQETKISELEERNQNLQEAMSGMTESFLSLQNIAMSVVTENGVRTQLQKSTEEFLGHARTVWEENEILGEIQEIARSQNLE